MPNYQQGKIYTIRSYKTDEIYIGSTTQPLSKRMVGHRGHYQRYIKTGKKHITSYEIIKHGDAFIELLEDYPCDNRNQLERREGELIRENDCVNKVIAGRTITEWRQENREKLNKYGVEWYKANPEKVKQHRDKHYQANREKINQKNKEYDKLNPEKKKQMDKNYYQANRERIIKRQKEYNNLNYEKIKETFTCECGTSYVQKNKTRHSLSKKHKEYIEFMSLTEEQVLRMLKV